MPQTTVKYKNLVIFSFIVLLWLPFATFKNYYPFLRFGMFAELNSSTTNTTESFEIYFEKDGKRNKFNSPMMGVNASTFEYLKRNHFYRKETNILLTTVAKRFENGNDFNWSFYQITTNGDSVLIERLKALQQ